MKRGIQKWKHIISALEKPTGYKIFQGHPVDPRKTAQSFGVGHGGWIGIYQAKKEKKFPVVAASTAVKTWDNWDMEEGQEGDSGKRRDRREYWAQLCAEAYTVVRSLDFILEGLRSYGQFFSSNLADFIWFGGKKVLFIHLDDYLIADTKIICKSDLSDT